MGFFLFTGMLKKLEFLKITGVASLENKIFLESDPASIFKVNEF